MNSTISTVLILALMAAVCLGDTMPMEEKETDNKATESKQIKMSDQDSKTSEKGKRAPVALTVVPTSLNSIPQNRPKVMIMPPVSLMIAMPHPSGRFLMLFPTTQFVPILPMPYAAAAPSPHAAAAFPPQNDHPAIFAARQQMLYNGPNYQQPRDHYYQPYSSQSYSNGYGQKDMSADM